MQFINGHVWRWYRWYLTNVYMLPVWLFVRLPICSLAPSLVWPMFSAHVLGSQPKYCLCLRLCPCLCLCHCSCPVATVCAHYSSIFWWYSVRFSLIFHINLVCLLLFLHLNRRGRSPFVPFSFKYFVCFCRKYVYKRLLYFISIHIL